MDAGAHSPVMHLGPKMRGNVLILGMVPTHGSHPTHACWSVFASHLMSEHARRMSAVHVAGPATAHGSHPSHPARPSTSPMVVHPSLSHRCLILGPHPVSPPSAGPSTTHNSQPSHLDGYLAKSPVV